MLAPSLEQSPPKFPSKLKFLFQPMRYKTARGGRGSGKSWGFARALILQGISTSLRILCAREIQNSIKDSVHKLLKDQIARMGVEESYTILDNEIRSNVNDTEFLFTGLGSLTVESIKSFEGVDICWVEEGQTISKRSWDILIPTIRKDDSEIWTSFNPQLETDPTYKRFVTSPPPDCISILMNWRDNPWFNELMNNERVYCMRTDQKGYFNIWEGQPRAAVEGAIFFEELQAMQREKRIRNVPYDSMLRVHIVCDLGFGHAMTIALVQVMGPEIRVIKYQEYFSGKLSDIASDLKLLRMNWGKVWLPRADGFSTTSKGQDSADKIWRSQGFSVSRKHEISDVTGKNAGIRVAKERFPRMYWDEMNCEQLIECARRYRRSINKITMVAGNPLDDEFADGGDTIRYIAINADSMTNELDDIEVPTSMVSSYQPLDAELGY